MHGRPPRLKAALIRLCAWTCLALPGALPGPAGVRGDDWPQWRGPRRDGLSRETGLLRAWPEAGPKLLWRVSNVGSGYSTPAVVGDHLYLLGNHGNEDESVLALAVKDGSQAWATRLGKVGNPDQQPSYPAARSTPTVDGTLLYALGSDGDLACLETQTGKIRWRKSLRDDFKGEPGRWAYAESPLVDGDAVVCTPGGAEATLVKLDKASGAVLWKCPVPGGDPAAYASVIITEAGGVRQYVQFLQGGLVGVEAATGKFLWRYDKTAQGSPANIPTPVARGAEVYSASARGGGGLVRIVAEGGKFEARPAYFSPKLPTSIGGAVLVGDDLFGTTGQGILCVTFADGQVKWSERGIGAGALCYADGRLYLHGEDGRLALVEATAEGYRPLGQFTPPGQPRHNKSKAWAYPVVANGRLYVRDGDALWCYDVKAEEVKAGEVKGDTGRQP